MLEKKLPCNQSRDKGARVSYTAFWICTELFKPFNCDVNFKCRLNLEEILFPLLLK